MIYFYLIEDAPTELLYGKLIKLNFDRREIIHKKRETLMLYLKNLGYTHINISN